MNFSDGVTEILHKQRGTHQPKEKSIRQLHPSCFTYGLETLAITQKAAEQLRVVQRAMERIMLGATFRDRIQNIQIRDSTKIGHVSRQEPDKWTQKVILWRPRETTRSVGRPEKRWIDDVRTVAGEQWMRLATDLLAWNNLEEAYIRQWMNTS
ncbi:uncharacterized protein LOC123675487 [Harmonia axyridis]|uniref:uncharacterized protein LOC123675487 n=1 Tax=Harmonia axyridis TaxID=115357 RepID=UPI001E275428|nr:uncharacterized protein LOC123675487 [Harmonia axyridis]